MKTNAPLARAVVGGLGLVTLGFWLPTTVCYDVGRTVSPAGGRTGTQQQNLSWRDNRPGNGMPVAFSQDAVSTISAAFTNVTGCSEARREPQRLTAAFFENAWPDVLGFGAVSKAANTARGGTDQTSFDRS